MFVAVDVDQTLTMKLRRSLAVLGFLATGLTMNQVAGSSAGVAATKKAPKEQVVLIEAGAVRYEPRVVRVVAGQPVVFRISNVSALAHEALLGDEKAQAAHAKEMASMPAMSHKPGSFKAGEGFVEIKSKGKGEIRTTFSKPGRTIIGCHLPGHYEGGMRLTVIVTPPALGR